jgi:hypothetical protein
MCYVDVEVCRKLARATGLHELFGSVLHLLLLLLSILLSVLYVPLYASVRHISLHFSLA